MFYELESLNAALASRLAAWNSEGVEYYLGTRLLADQESESWH